MQQGFEKLCLNLHSCRGGWEGVYEILIGHRVAKRQIRLAATLSHTMPGDDLSPALWHSTYFELGGSIMIRKMMTFTFCLALVAGLFGVLPVPGVLAATVTEWCFQDVGGVFTLTPNQGTGTATAGTGISTTNFAGNSSSSCTAGRAWAGTNWTSSASLDVDDYFEFSVSTVGKSGISFKFDHQRSATGPTTFDFHYSTDGNNFNAFATGQTAPTAFASSPMSSFDLSSIAALDDNPNAKFRLYAYGASSTGGTWRIDNVVVENSGTLAVTLASFGATQQGDAVLVTWETASELDNLGFNLYRATSPAASTTQLNAALIPSLAPGSTAGFVYTWEDRADLVAGQTYYYWLEDVALSGATRLHGPVSAAYLGPTAVTLVDLQAGSRVDRWPFAVALASLAVLAGAAIQRLRLVR